MSTTPTRARSHYRECTDFQQVLCQSRQKFAEILNVFQEFLTKSGAKPAKR